MTQPFRADTGGQIDRDAPCTFLFNGRCFTGYRGDTLASALLANGARIVGRSFKYHRPRGIFSIGSEEPNALLQLESGPHAEPNCRATQSELYDGLIASSQNHWPSLRWDLLRINDWTGPLLAAGFYYKTFMRPARLWPFYERIIRRMAGLGRAPATTDPDSYEQRHAHCDVLVVGAGPAGLRAALAAAISGAQVMLVDENARAGGWLRRERALVDGSDGAAWAERLCSRLTTMANVRVLPRATAFGYYDHNCIAITERLADHLAPAQRQALRQPRQRLWRVRAGRVILACGALEQPLLFAGNDLPGIMLAGAARGYLNQYAVRPGTRAVIATNNDSAYRTAFDLHDAGIEVTAVADLRATVDPTLRGLLDERNIPHHVGTGVLRARGRRMLEAVDLAPFIAGQWQAGATAAFSCDLLCVSGGWVPTLHLHAQSGGRVRFEAEPGIFLPDTPKQESRCIGAMAGTWELAACLREGSASGIDAARGLGFHAPAESVAVDARLPACGPGIQQSSPSPAPGKCFVDLQNDVTTADVRLAHREGYRSVEHLKRYTTLGMGTDQGKTSNLPGLTLLATHRGEPVPVVGTTTFRPPFTPVTLGVLAGEARDAHLAPVRRSPMHVVQEKSGAAWIAQGAWQRPARFPQPREKPADTVAREVRTVRGGIGIADVSTLGKFELRGPGSAEFLDRVFVNDFTAATPGRTFYGILLREDGMVLDDGTVTSLAPDHWFLTCSTSHAGEVREHLEYLLDAAWPELDVHLADVTEQWAAVAVAGPRARHWLQRLVAGESAELRTLPHMRCLHGTVAGLPARLLRVSFSGEYACEIFVPSGVGADLWRRLLAEGGGENVTPFGLDAMDVLRIEKGYIAAGAEIDGRTCPWDLRLERLVKRQRRFIGFHGLQRQALQRADRRQLVGLLATDPHRPVRAGAQLVATRDARGFGACVGHVTSAAWSPTLGRHLALALLEGGRARAGETIHVADPLRDGRKRRTVTVTDPVFYDAAGVQLR